MEYQVNFETSWIAGLWSADRGSTAKGVVAINNKNDTLRSNFRDYSLRNFDIREGKFREREINGYGRTFEVYFTRLPVRKFIERIAKQRESLSKKNKLAFLAGKLDGDGTVDFKRSLLCYYYGLSEQEEIRMDRKSIESLGFITSIGTCGKKALRLRVLKPRYFAKEIIRFTQHPDKREGLKKLIKKRSYRA